MKENLIKVGTITSTHGIKGELKVNGDNTCFSPSFKAALFIGTNPMTEVHVKTVKNQNDRLIVGFKEFNDINQVERFKNCAIYADRDTLEPLEEGEVYLNDLLDLEVYNQDDKYIGVVKEVREYPQCYYLVIETEEGKTHLIPFINEFVTDVFDDAIIINEMEGLLL